MRSYEGVEFFVMWFNFFWLSYKKERKGSSIKIKGYFGLDFKVFINFMKKNFKNVF